MSRDHLTSMCKEYVRHRCIVVTIEQMVRAIAEEELGEAFLRLDMTPDGIVRVWSRRRANRDFSLFAARLEPMGFHVEIV